MKMRVEPRVLLTVALLLGSGFGCGEGQDDLGGGGGFEAGLGPVTGNKDAGAGGQTGQQPGQPGGQQPGQPGGQQPGTPGGTAGGGAPGGQQPGTPGGTAGGGTPGGTPTTDGGGTTSGLDAGGGPGAGTDAGPGAPDAAQPDGGAQPGMGGGGDRILPPVDDVNKDGPFKVTIDTKPNFVTWHPTELGKDGLKHPVFVWGTGSGALPERYNDHFNRMASHGFVIVSPNKTQKSGSDMKAALDYILAENMKSGGTYYQKLDPNRVAMGGHSQGSTSTFDQEANETRIKTSIHIAGGSFDGQGSAKVKTPTAYICGETDIALNNCNRDFMNVKTQPTFYSVLMGVDHVQCARQALPGMIAWLRWHLAGETERAAQFTGPGGDFFKGIWKSQTKNWPPK